MKARQESLKDHCSAAELLPHESGVAGTRTRDRCTFKRIRANAASENLRRQGLMKHCRALPLSYGPAKLLLEPPGVEPGASDSEGHVVPPAFVANCEKLGGDKS